MVGEGELQTIRLDEKQFKLLVTMIDASVKYWSKPSVRTSEQKLEAELYAKLALVYGVAKL